MKNYMTINDIKRRVLIVDDEPINRELLGTMLSQTFEIATASNGQEAMMMLTQPDADYSLILLDLLMPVMDGFEVIKNLRANPDTADIQIVILSALNSNEDIVKGFNVGANDFIMKPIIMEKLLTCVVTQLQLVEAKKGGK